MKPRPVVDDESVMAPGRQAARGRRWPVLQRPSPWALAGVLGAALLAGVYMGIVTLAQGWQHALTLFWEDRFLVTPIIAGFGTQVGLYTYLRFGLGGAPRGSGAVAGAGGGTSTAAMVACCAHHVTDLLPLVGLSAATAFLANYKVPFMLLGLAMNLVGIGLALRTIRQQRRRLAAASAVAI
ncbi:MAG TPA: hypothetical protein VLC52_16025 [Anaerolineae bacterium]|nr:hypothetical protein [Anaerolineae bacterium]